MIIIQMHVNMPYLDIFPIDVIYALMRYLLHVQMVSMQIRHHKNLVSHFLAMSIIIIFFN